MCVTYIDPRLIEAAGLGEFRDPLLRKVYHRIIVDRKVEDAKKKKVSQLISINQDCYSKLLGCGCLLTAGLRCLGMDMQSPRQGQ